MSKPVTASSWTELRSLVDQAIDLSREERDAFLDQHCGDNPRLRAHVLSLLELDDTVISGEPDFPMAASWENARVGPYRILEELGQGGMGAVYLAERADGEFEHRVAIKVVGRGPLTKDLHRRFLLERQVLARLTHPNIARLLDGGTTDDGTPYLVMEHIEGENILRHCRRRELGLEDQLRLFIGACRGVSFAHRNLVIHRDLKPGNILVRNDGTPKLLDFGIAKLLDAADDGLTVAGQAPGTLGYTSPEQLQGEPVSTASDVYSLGVVLFEMLTGDRPFGPTEGALVAVARAMRGENPTIASRAAERWAKESGIQPTVKPHQLEGDLDRILSRALAGDPAERYGSAQELADDLERFLRHEPVSVVPPKLSYVLGKFIRRRAGTVLAGLLIGLSLLGGFIARSIEARRAEEQRVTAVSERAKAEELAAFMIQDLWSALKPLGRLDLMAPVSEKLMAYYQGRADDSLSSEEHEQWIQTLSALAEVAMASGDVERGLENRRQILAEIKALPVPLDQEGRGEYQRWVISAVLDLAEAHQEAGNGGAAVAVYAEARGLIADEKLAGRHASELTLLEIGCLDSWGVALYDLGRLDEAGEKFQAAFDRAVTLPDEMPVDDKLIPQQMTLFHLAVVQMDQGNLSRALADIEGALQLAEQSWRRKPESMDRLYGWTLTRTVLAKILLKTGRLDDALTAAQEVVLPLEEAVQRDPANAETRYQLSTLLIELARVHKARGDLEAERSTFEQIVALGAPLAETTGHTYLLDSYIRALLGLGRLEEAEGPARHLLAQGWDHQDFRAFCAEHGIVELG